MQIINFFSAPSGADHPYARRTALVQTAIPGVFCSFPSEPAERRTAGVSYIGTPGGEGGVKPYVTAQAKTHLKPRSTKPCSAKTVLRYFTPDFPLLSSSLLPVNGTSLTIPRARIPGTNQYFCNIHY